MAILGPTRLILVNAAKFHYADVDLTRPLHLVGPNNVGKTTLVNLLQFLYVDGLNHMSFPGYDLSQTRRYYFPSRQSYVLFECRTPSGRRVVGVHGRGPAENYEVQRFAYTGAFERADVVADGEDGFVPRDVRDVKTSLALKGYTELEARHLRAALTGVGDAKGVRLGLIPVQSANGYAKFRDLFKGLIRLRQLDQDALKATLCNTYASELDALEVDLEDAYAQQFDRMKQQRREIGAIERLVQDVNEALSLHAKRTRLRTTLVRRWHRLQDAARRRRTWLRDAVSTLSGAIDSDTEALNASRQTRTEADAQKARLNRTLGRLEAKVEDVTNLIEAFADFDPDAARARIDTLETKRATILADLKSVEAASPDAIRADLQRVTNAIEKRRRRLHNLQDLLGSLLRNRLDADRLDRLFRVLNPELLDLNRTGPHLTLSDPDALVERLRAYDATLSDDPWTSDWGALSLQGLSSPSLDDYIDADRIRAELNAERRRQTDLQHRLQVAETVTKRRERARTLQSEIDTLREQLRRSAEAQDAKQSLDTLCAERQSVQEALTTVQAELDAVDAAIRSCTESLRQHKAQRSTHRDALKRLQNDLRALTPPPNDWPTDVGDTDGVDDAEASVPHPDDDSGGDSGGDSDNAEIVSSLMDAFRDGVERERRLSTRLNAVLERIHRDTYGEYRRASLADTLDGLREEVDGVAERRRAVEEMWRQLLTGLGRKLSDLLTSLDLMRNKITTINRRLSGTSVSDLKRLRLVLQPVASMVHLLKRVATQESMPLFGDQGTYEADLDELEKILRTHPRIRLTDLFTVGFEITTADGSTRHYDGLDNIQSNGTGITIKVLVHLVLINDLLNDTPRTLPFYLDEASSLDEQNLAGIVDAATAMNFIPILASPTESTAVEHIYYLRTQGDRVYLGPEHRVRLSTARNATRSA